jgi:phytoene synthase
MSTDVSLILPASAEAGAVGLDESRDFCQQLTRREARNFYYGLRLLPEPKRGAMYALYAYMRLLDDIADADDGRSLRQRLEDVNAWQEMTRDALEGRLPDRTAANGAHRLWPAFADMVQRHGVPGECFEDAIAGQRQDLEPVRFETFDDLREYCRRVAGVVGVASIYIWGFEGGEQTVNLALERGLAFQLTNILRDLREDAANGRIYLPREDLAANNVTENAMLAGRGGEGFRELMRFQIDRARAAYERSAELESCIAPDSRATLVAMTAIYRGLLDKIAQEPDCVLRRRVSLSLITKLQIAWRATRGG